MCENEKKGEGDAPNKNEEESAAHWMVSSQQKWNIKRIDVIFDKGPSNDIQWNSSESECQIAKIKLFKKKKTHIGKRKNFDFCRKMRLVSIRNYKSIIRLKTNKKKHIEIIHPPGDEIATEQTVNCQPTDCMLACLSSYPKSGWARER